MKTPSWHTLARAAILLLCALAVPAHAAVPPGVTVMHDIAYGPATLQTMDVYLPPQPKTAPIILMVHGGAWAFGDKANDQVYENKVARWVPRGFIFVSVNYPMVPDSNPEQQADDAARAIAAVQRAAPGWGGDPARLILMGHSAGAHLVTLLNADPSRAARLGAGPWLGTVSLDSGALDVPGIMQHPHMRFYDTAFGRDPGLWQAASPIHHLTRDGPPWLGVCNSMRSASCGPNEEYAAKARALGLRVEILGEPLRHSEINRELGQPGAYTDAVEDFMASLDPTVKQLLGR
ncbi:MAG TPA: alpha/beta hydrolase [Dongiaceae bacterium]|nr:alpha/beta hydrolase [Dongiaceae bacterium]